MRKALIAIIAFVAVGIGFWIFMIVMDPSPIIPPNSENSPDIEIPQTTTTPQKIGDMTPGEVEDAKYIKLDPVTKEVVAEYGFKQMLNPGQGRNRWEVEKPYIVFYRPDYQCRIDSDLGVFQVESGGSSSMPENAQLEKNVVIHLTPGPGNQMGETFIYMDDLVFSSERSEFTTDGPVRVDSPKIQMDGLGLILIFNTAQGRIEYLQLRDLDYLQLKDIATAEIPAPSNDAEAVDKPSSPPKDRQMAAHTNETSPDKKNDETTGTPIPDDVTTPDYYLCTIEDNVEIQYGDELIVSGADQVNIRNIDFGGMDEANSDSGSTVASSADTKVSDDKQPKPKPKSKTPETSVVASEPDRQASTESDSGREVMVKCDGGIILQPMPVQSTTNPTDAEEPDLALEMSGRPLRIDRIVLARSNENETLAHCASLKYKPADDVLRLFTSPLQPEILLNSEGSNSRIQTCGNVFWDRKAQHANIAGPGKVTIGNVNRPSAEPSEINFQGMMDLLFARMPLGNAAPTIQTINLTGGMDAVLRQNGTLKTKSDSAVLEFGQENMLAEARLNGDVHFESLDTDKPSQAASESAVFHFADNQIALADLDGGVSFASADGQFASSKAVIEFEPDAAGAMHPKVLRTTGKAVMQTVSPNGQPPAKFEAQKIDYDLETGAGLAYGPIRVTNYQQPSNPACLDDWVPLTITADDDAQFFADENRTIKRVVFNKNVVAARLTNMPTFIQRDQLHGDKLVVDFNKDATGQTAVSKIAITEGNVFTESKKTRGEETLFHMKLNCERIDYDGVVQKIVAAGPGKIELDNSKAGEEASDAAAGVNFKRSCYALIQGFEVLEWDMVDQTIVADGREDTMEVAYVPLKDGQVEKYLYVNSQQIQASFLSDTDGKLTLRRIFTDKGIVYNEIDGITKKTNILLAGQSLEYDVFTDAAWLTISGSEDNPCFINGLRAPQVRYNLNTGKLDKTSISRTPGVLSN